MLDGLPGFAFLVIFWSFWGWFCFLGDFLFWALLKDLLGIFVWLLKQIQGVLDGFVSPRAPSIPS